MTSLSRGIASAPPRRPTVSAYSQHADRSKLTQLLRSTRSVHNDTCPPDVPYVRLRDTLCVMCCKRWFTCVRVWLTDHPRARIYWQSGISLLPHSAHRSWSRSASAEIHIIRMLWLGVWGVHRRFSSVIRVQISARTVQCSLLGPHTQAHLDRRSASRPGMMFRCGCPRSCRYG